MQTKFFPTDADGYNSIGSGGIETLDYVCLGRMMGKAFFHFSAIDIPNGSSIASAILMLTEFRGENASCALNVAAHAADDSAPPANGSVLYSLPLTSIIPWTMQPIAENDDHTSPNLATILQELVNRPGWTAGNGITLRLDENASAAYRFVRSLEYSSGDYTGTLMVEFEPPAEPDPEPDPDPELEPEPEPDPEYVPPELYSAGFPVPEVYARLMAAALLLKGGKKCLDGRFSQSSIVPGVGYVTAVSGPHGYMNKEEDRILAVHDHQDGNITFEWIVNTNGTEPLLDAANAWAAAKIMEAFGLEGDAMSPQGSKIVNNHICIWNDTQLLIANMGMTPVFNGVLNPNLIIYDIDALEGGSLLIKGKVVNLEGEYGCMEFTYNTETGFFAAGPFLFR